MDDCFKLIGFRDDFEFTKGKNALVKGNATLTGEDTHEFRDGYMREG